MRICPKCGHKDPAAIRAAAKYEAKRLARLKRLRRKARG